MIGRKDLLFHSSTGELVVVAVASLGSEIVVVSLQHIFEYLLILRYEKVVFLFKMSDDVAGEGSCNVEVGLALVEAGALDGARADI